MRSKLMLLFAIVVLLMFGLIGNLMYIIYTSGEKYEKKVQQHLSSHPDSTLHGCNTHSKLSAYCDGKLRCGVGGFTKLL